VSATSIENEKSATFAGAKIFPRPSPFSFVCVCVCVVELGRIIELKKHISIRSVSSSTGRRSTPRKETFLCYLSLPLLSITSFAIYHFPSLAAGQVI